MQYRNIILFGFRYTGKTTIGEVLAEINNFKFVDLDFEIEKTSGIKIFDFVQTESGWNDFRRIEFELFEKFIEEENVVISCGAGVGINNAKYKNKTFGEFEIEILNNTENSLKILLYANESSVVERIKVDALKRPLLSSKKTLSLDEIIEENLMLNIKRKPIYENIKYDMKLDSSDNNLYELVRNGGKINSKIEIQNIREIDRIKRIFNFKIIGV